MSEHANTRVVADDDDDRRIAELLGTSVDASAEDLTQLHRRLERAADDRGLLDIAYTTVDSPVGALLLAATARGLLRVAYESEGFARVLDTLGDRVSRRILRAPQRLDPAAKEIDQYFEGERRSFDLALDLSLSSGFRRIVQQHLPEIAYGSTESYKQVAALVGNPNATRAVGTACATNPLPIVVPCHRVLRTDGSLGGYIGGLQAKTALLKLEASASVDR